MKLFYIIGIIQFTTMIFTPQGLAQTKTLKPLYQGDKIVVEESGRTSVYYLLSKINSSYLLVKGPGQLLVSTRSVMNDNDRTADYQILYRIDGGDLLKQAFNSEYTAGVTFKKGISGRPGSRKSFQIELGPGEHSLEFSIGRDINPVVAKYQFKKTSTQKINWVMLSPARPNEPVDLVTHENVIHYYRFSQKKPLKISVNGSTTLRILTRFENHYNMKGRINYRLQLKEDGRIIHTYLMSSMYSEVTTYNKSGRSTPGKACEFYIQVPSGRHNYTVVPLDKDKGTILARVLLPKKDVKLEE